MSGERKGERASARSTTSACIDGALSWDKRSLPSAQYGAGSSGFQNASIKAGIALELPAESVCSQGRGRGDQHALRRTGCDGNGFVAQPVKTLQSEKDAAPVR